MMMAIFFMGLYSLCFHDYYGVVVVNGHVLGADEGEPVLFDGFGE